MDYRELSEELIYDPATGRFTWKKEPGTISNGYHYIRVNQRTLLAHRIAWLLATGEDPDGLVIDHINYHKGIPERVAVIEQRLADERHTQDARYQKALIWLASALAAVGSLLVGAVVHFLHL